jgi:hypothetical protein
MNIGHITSIGKRYEGELKTLTVLRTITIEPNRNGARTSRTTACSMHQPVKSATLPRILERPTDADDRTDSGPISVIFGARYTVPDHAARRIHSRWSLTRRPVKGNGWPVKQFIASFCVLMLSCLVHAREQSGSEPPLPTFEVASVKPNEARGPVLLTIRNMVRSSVRGSLSAGS